MKRLLNLVLTMSVTMMLFQACNKNDGYFAKETVSGIANVGDEGGGDPVIILGDPTGAGDPPDINPPAPPEPPVQPEPPVVNLNQPRSQVFVVTGEKAPVDVLFVIDNSGSMIEEQAGLASNLNQFIQGFLIEQLDFKMAVTSTDPRSDANCNTSNSGSYVDGKKRNRDGCEYNGSISKLTSQKAAQNEALFLSNFQQSVSLGIKGSGNESGLYTAKRFLERHNSSFLRPNANLAIVVLSDENDVSSGSVASYVNYYKSLKADPSKVKFHSIVTFNPQAQWESIGVRYKDASESTGGISASIHADFATTLMTIGNSIVNLSTSFILTQAPVAGTLQVKVNGQLVSSGYSYNAQNNSISFEPALPMGSQIQVNYLVPSSSAPAL